MKRTFKNNFGITLIALVITIIVLLILAGVTIAALSGDNGILKNAGKAKEKTEQAEEDELRKLTALEAATNLEQTTHTDNSMGEEQERTVTIPAGFSVSKVEGENTIAEGLVIIDSSGNEYVWIPVDGVLWDEETSLQDVTERGKILLGRYVFKTDGTIDTNLTPTTLGGKLDQLGEPTAAYYTEDSTDNGVNSFIQSVRDNGGYYIGRYEAGVENGELDSTDIIEGDSYIAAPNDNWTAYVGNNIQLVSKSGVTPWTYITKNKASALCQNLYLGISSDLINSYAWDTAILFIQQKGKKENSSSYSVQNGGSTTSEIALTGTGVLLNTGEEDKQCNIYDMAGNCREYTTETYSQSTQPYTSRGGYSSNHDSTRNTRIRYGNTLTNIDLLLSFRPILYL